MGPVIDYSRRRAALAKVLDDSGLDSFLVTSETNVSYLSGFIGHDSLLLITKKKNFFITDSRYIEDAASTVKGFEIELVSSSTYDTIESLVGASGARRVGFEAVNLPYAVALRLKKILGKVGFVATRDVVENIRALKDEAELESIKKSIRLTKDVLARAISFVKPGVSEASVSRMIEIEFIRSGARIGFDPIVASGANSSKPHARPQGTAIKKDSVVMMDIGCNLDGYCSDITRMLFLGRVKERFKKIYTIVRKAQEEAIAKIRPGARVRDIDAAGRGHIERAGFGKYFGHSLGHGVGMEVHEQPSISKLSEIVLKPGMVFTVEPAIYIPRLGGVRIEDMVTVTDKGCELLTR